MHVLVVTHLFGFVEMEIVAFFPFLTRRRLNPRGSRLPLKPPVSHLRYASQVIPVRSQYLRLGNYRHFKSIKGNTVTQSCAIVGVAKVPRTPPPPRGGRGSAGRKRNEHEKPTVLCLNLPARLPRPWPGTERGGPAGRKNAGTTPSPAQSGKKHPEPSPKTRKACLVPR